MRHLQLLAGTMLLLLLSACDVLSQLDYNQTRFEYLVLPGDIDQDGLGIAVASDGTVYLGGENPLTYVYRVQKVTPAGIVSTFTEFDTTYSVVDLALDSAGNLYVLTSGFYSNPSFGIRKVTPAGVATEITTAGMATYGRTPVRLAVDGTSTLFVLERFSWGHYLIEKVSPAGTSSNYAEWDGYEDCVGFSIGSDGALYFASGSSQNLGRIDSSGSVNTSWKTWFFPDPNYYFYLTDFAMDASGKRYSLGYQNVYQIGSDNFIYPIAGYGYGSDSVFTSIDSSHLEATANGIYVLVNSPRRIGLIKERP